MTLPYLWQLCWKNPTWRKLEEISLPKFSNNFLLVLWQSKTTWEAHVIAPPVLQTWDLWRAGIWHHQAELLVKLILPIVNSEWLWLYCTNLNLLEMSCHWECSIAIICIQCSSFRNPRFTTPNIYQICFFYGWKNYCKPFSPTNKINM